MSMPTVVCVVGARPQFVKLGPVSRALRAAGIHEIVLHTGQHYDYSMSQSFFDELDLPEPDLNLGIATPGPTAQLGEMVPAMSEALRRIEPQMAVVFGDTTSTIATALAASYDGIAVAHIEAGMRSFVPSMPEEIARIVTDRLSQLWFTASAGAEEHLAREGLGPTDFVGDTMFDVVRGILPQLSDASELHATYGVEAGAYVLATVHRANNTDEAPRLRGILEGLSRLPLPVIFPVHPRTRAAIDRHGFADRLKGSQVQVVEPLRYLETMKLARHSRRVFTDSGGLQKEAMYLGVPCTVLRDETEWVETVETGWNVLAGADAQKILASLDHEPPSRVPPEVYGDGTAGTKIAQKILERL
jgi:UDP-GlcNAc3NAcA epimerase